MTTSALRGQHSQKKNGWGAAQRTAITKCVVFALCFRPWTHTSDDSYIEQRIFDIKRVCSHISWGRWETLGR